MFSIHMHNFDPWNPLITIRRHMTVSTEQLVSNHRPCWSSRIMVAVRR